MNRMGGAPRAPPWGWIMLLSIRSLTILTPFSAMRAASRELGVELGQGDPNAFEPAAANENVPRERTG
jgi:hypothetical protein